MDLNLISEPGGMFSWINIGLFETLAWGLGISVAMIWCFSLLRKRDGDAMSGYRFQMLRSLRAMYRGELAVMEMCIADVNKILDDEEFKRKWFESLKDHKAWSTGSGGEVEAILLPGTWFARPIGRHMLREGWCAPIEKAHWVPNLRYYYLTKEGEQAMWVLHQWWSSLSLLDKIGVALSE